MSKKVFGPASEKQRKFLQSNSTIIVYGGEFAPPLKTLLNGES